MDPLGLGPLTMSYAVLFGSQDYTAWVKREFEELMARIRRAKSRVGSRAKVLVGGPGSGNSPSCLRSWRGLG